jgi:hypothetical protein
MESDFHLAKWYFDCVAENGETIIGYSAIVQWKKFKLHYTSLLQGSFTASFTSLRFLLPTEFPQQHNDTITWSCDGLDAHGSWKRMYPPTERTLHQNEHGSIRWSCIMPCAETAMRIGDRHLYGFGYVEFLEMTIPPWKLPIDELRWGRFLSAPDSLVWIDWKGANPLRLAVHNGAEIKCNSVNDSVISCFDNNLSVQMDRSMIVRNGAIINTALKKIPGIDLVIPKNILQTDECKWLSQGKLNTGDHSSNGFAIHEIVRFI